MSIELYENHKDSGEGKTCEECEVTNRFVVKYEYLGKTLCPECRDEIDDEED